MRFTCPRCGKKYASADEPAPGRVYSLTCRCGTKITVKGPEARPPGAPEPAPAPPAGGGFDPFPTERRRTQGGAPVSNVDTGSLPVAPRPGDATPSSSWSSRTQTQRVPLKEATPAPVAPRPAARPVPAAPRAAPPPAASLDPFADMPDLQAEARGEARPLTSVPEIRGPLPEPPGAPASYDPFAAQQGLLLDEEQARAIAGPVIEPRVEPAASGPDESAVTFSQEMPASAKRRARAVLPRVASRGRSRLALFAAALAVVGAGAGAAWFFLGRTRSSPPTQAVALPPTSAPQGAPPAPAPIPPAAAAPAPVPAAAAAATPLPSPAQAAATPPPAPPSAATPEPRPEHRREAPRKAETRRTHRQVAAAAAAPEPPPRREPERPEPPPKAEEPPKKPDLVAKKPDTGPGAAPAGGAVRTELTSAEVGASIKASAQAFDACVAEAVRNEPALQVVGRRVGLYITVNPSGLVTAPRLDDADLDDSVLGACLKSTARKMVFPAFQGESFQVRIPMVLGGGR